MKHFNYPFLILHFLIFNLLTMKKLTLLFTLLLTVFAGCSDDDNDQAKQENYIKQGWQLASLNINGEDIDISHIPLPELMYFGDQNVCYLAIPDYKSGEWVYTDSRTAWNYEKPDQILNIASLLPVTNYADAVESNRLVLRSYTFNTTGDINTNIKEFHPVAVKIENLKLRLDK